MSSALRDVLLACYESGGADEATGAQLDPKLQVGLVLPNRIRTAVTSGFYKTEM